MGFVTMGIFLVFNLMGNNPTAAAIGLEGAKVQNDIPRTNFCSIIFVLVLCISIPFQINKE